MSFFPSSDNPTRRFRPRRDVMREASPESDMFFETSPAFGLARSHLADRLGSSVFEDFPTRRTMRSFPSDTPAFGSLHRHRQHPGSWGATAENHGSQDSSPTEGREAGNMRHPFFQRSESIPVRVSHESRHGSRSSTPESTGSGHSHASSSHSSRPHSNGPDSSAADGSHDDGSVQEGAEEHAGVASRPGRPSYTARRQPKVHHIPIHVEPRDGSHPVVLTPPAESTNSRAPPDLAPNRESPSTPHKKVAKQVFAMPPVPPNAARDGPDLRGNGNGNAVPEEVKVAPKNDNASKERVVPLSEHDGREPSIPKAAGEAEAAATLPVPDKKKRTAEELVEEVRLDVEHQRKCVEVFAGERGDKHYLYLDEMLTRDLIKLDNIATDGNDELRKARRAVIVAINSCIQALERKVSNAKLAGVETGVPAERDESAGEEGEQRRQQPPAEEMDVSKGEEEITAADPSADRRSEPSPNDGSEIKSAAAEERRQSSETVPSKEEADPQPEQTPPSEAEEVAMETEVSDAVPVPVETDV